MIRFQQNEKLIRGFWMVAVISVVAMVLEWTGLTHVYEQKTIDIRTGIVRKNKSLSPDAVVILIDEASLETLNLIAGRWPWPREIHARLIDFLEQSGARQVVMDILFTENETGNMSDHFVIGENDQQLVDATGQAENVIHAAQFANDPEDAYNPGITNMPLPDEFIRRFSLKVNAPDVSAPEFNKYYLPFIELYEKSKGVGVVTFLPDSDGVFRKEKLVFDYQGNFFPALSLSSLLDRLKPEQIILMDNLLKIQTRDREINVPLTGNREYYVNMYGRYEVFSYSGVYDTILNIERGEVDHLAVDPSVFKNKTVFVGASAVGVENLKHTSISTRTPGVLLHASIYGNIISEDFLVFGHPLLSILMTLFLVIMTVFSIFYLKTVYSQALIPVILMLGYYGMAISWFQNNIVLHVATPSLAFLVAYISGFTHISATEGKEKRKIKNILGQYVSPAMLADVLEKHKEDYFRAEVGTKEVLTIFFSDIRDFTSISEKYDVEKVVELLNDYLSRMVNIIFGNSGTLDKFIGDAIVAFWGAPVKISDHPYKAIVSALQMEKALKDLNREGTVKGMPELKIGIGIHTGEVILGNIGSEKKLDYTVIGDSVNLASRLEGLTKTYHSTIVITQDTYAYIKDKVHCRLLDYVKVKGKDQPIKIYSVLGEPENVDQKTLEVVNLTEKGFDEYRRKRFSDAVNVFKQIQAIQPDDFLSQIFISRCEEFIENPPDEEWDGYYAFKTK